MLRAAVGPSTFHKRTHAASSPSWLDGFQHINTVYNDIRLLLIGLLGDQDGSSWQVTVVASCCLERAAPPLASLKYTFMRSNCRSLSPCISTSLLGSGQFLSKEVAGTRSKVCRNGYLVGADGVDAVLIADHLQQHQHV